MKLDELKAKAAVLREIADARALTISTRYGAAAAPGGQIEDWGSLPQIRDREADALADFADALVQAISDLTAPWAR